MVLPGTRNAATDKERVLVACEAAEQGIGVSVERERGAFREQERVVSMEREREVSDKRERGAFREREPEVLNESNREGRKQREVVPGKRSMVAEVRGHEVW